MATKRTIAELDNDMLLCRAGLLAHRWDWARDDNIVTNTRNTPVEVTRVEACERCGSEREYVYSLPSFSIKKSRRRYPKGYLLAGGGGRVSASEVRREHFERTGGRLMPYTFVEGS